jgi:parallel beta-helix repeat protein
MGHKPGMHAGGIKLINAVNTTVEKNYVLDNEGAGIWVDIGSNGVEVHHNVIVETKNVDGLQARGIQYEMSSGNRSPGKLDIHNNILRVDGGVAGIISIYALNSQYLEIFRNTISGAQNGIVVKQDSRGYAGNCANGYSGCISCSGSNYDQSCDNNCIAGGNNTDEPAGARCMQQIREIKVYYNDVSVGGSGYLLTGLLVEPGPGQTGTEPNGITPERYYNKSAYNIDIDFNNYTIPGNPLYANAFQWGWDTSLQISKRLVWEQANDFVDFNSCINGLCAGTTASARTSAATITLYPNPFVASVSASLSGVKLSNDVVLVLTAMDGVAVKLRPSDVEDDRVTFDMGGIPVGRYAAKLYHQGALVTTTQLEKK